MRFRRAHDRTPDTDPPAAPPGGGDVRRRAVRRARLALVIAAAVALPGGITAGATAMMSPGGDGPASRPPGTRPTPDAGAAALDPALVAFMEPELLEAVPVGPGAVASPVADVLGSAEVVTRLDASGIPEVAARAYMQAADRQAVDDPGCGIRWTLLAAIGRVESNHGRFGGAQLRDDGYGTRPIRGIPLDGRDNVLLIRDTDDGELDRDTTYDRAVGPLQFIPSTWGRWGADGNGDGGKDPNNIFDAALGAARYLCAGGADLRAPEARAAAVRRYNNADEYVSLVLRLAAEYETGGVERIPPVGNPPFEAVPSPRPDPDPFPPPAVTPNPSPSPPPVAAPSPSSPPPSPSPTPAPADPPSSGDDLPAPAPNASPAPSPTPPTTVAPDPAPAPRPAPGPDANPAPGQPAPAPAPQPNPGTPPTTAPPEPPPAQQPPTTPPTTAPAEEPPAESPDTTVPGDSGAPAPEPPDTAAVGWAPAMREVVVDILDDQPAPPADPATPAPPPEPEPAADPGAAPADAAPAPEPAPQPAQTAPPTCPPGPAGAAPPAPAPPAGCPPTAVSDNP
jgi:hypothetical protein